MPGTLYMRRANVLRAIMAGPVEKYGAGGTSLKYGGVLLFRALVSPQLKKGAVRRKQHAGRETFS